VIVLDEQAFAFERFAFWAFEALMIRIIFFV